MIYKKSYFKKEFGGAYNEDRLSISRGIAIGLFLGLFSFAIHFVLQTLTKSVLSDAVPEFMQPSYFSTLYIFIFVSFFFNIVYFMTYYERLTFAEIRKNRWYLLVKMGYEPTQMIFSKLFARVLSVGFPYTVGFLFTIFLTVFLKYSFVYNYFFPLYITGLIDITVLVLLTLAMSLYLKHPSDARFSIFFASIALIVLKIVSGFYQVASNRILMQKLYNLFDLSASPYLVIVAFLVLLSLTVSIMKAGSVAKYYNLPNSYPFHPVSSEASLYFSELQEGKPILKKKISLNRGPQRSSLLNSITMAILVVFVTSSLIFNAFVIVLSTSQPGKEISILGTIPYIFKTDTMTPTIMENDLAYFQKIDDQASLAVGDVVVFLEEKTVFIERVRSQEGQRYMVDIDHYPEMTQPGAMVKEIGREQIYGKYVGRSRWLGALILFANTTFGRILWMLIPAIILFFYKPIFVTIKRVTSETDFF
jgi:hypothetical protein